jgi:signal transduction histidine kinase
MWSFAKRSRQMSLSNAELKGTIVERTAEVQNLSQRLLKVQDEERRRLARDLHDTTAQTLAALKISVALLQEDCKRFCSQVLRRADDQLETKTSEDHKHNLQLYGARCKCQNVSNSLALNGKLTAIAPA